MAKKTVLACDVKGCPATVAEENAGPANWRVVGVRAPGEEFSSFDVCPEHVAALPEGLTPKPADVDSES